MIVVPSSLWKIIQTTSSRVVSLSQQPAMQVRDRARRSAESASGATRQSVSPERPVLDQTRRARVLGGFMPPLASSGLADKRLLKRGEPVERLRRQGTAAYGGERLLEFSLCGHSHE